MTPCAIFRLRCSIAACALAAALATCGERPAETPAPTAGEALPPPAPAEVSEELDRLFAGFECVDCNVLLLTLDTVRADSLPCYGSADDTAPEICAFAEGAVLFENAYSAAPATLPALTSLLSGSVVANEPLDEILAHYEGQEFLAERLAALDYTTAALTDHRGIGNTNKSKKYGFLSGFDHFENLGEGKRGRTSEPLAGLAVRWLEENAGEKFFLWVHFFDPHFNWLPPPELEGRFGFDVASCGRIENGMDIVEIREIESTLTPREIDCLEALHHAEIYYTDQYVGQVLAAVERLGVAAETLVVIASDHGEEFMERGRVGHETTVYNELIHVPMVIGNPRGAGPRRVVGAIGTPAIYDIVLGAVSGEPITVEPAVASRTHHYYGRFLRREEGAARTEPNDYALVVGRSKTIFNPTTKAFGHFDLEADPGEIGEPAVGRSEQRGALALISDWLEVHRVEAGPLSAEGQKEFDEAQERLKSLGYIR